MMGLLSRTFDSLLGRGAAAVTVPALDGALRPNRRLDEATARFPLPDVTCVVESGGELLAAAGRAVVALDADGRWTARFELERAISCMAALADGGLAIALVTGEIVIRGGPLESRRFAVAPNVTCITAMTAAGSALLVANGSATNPAEAWQLDLLQRHASGSVWRLDLDSGKAERCASDLAFPAGLILDGDRLVVAEAWEHRLVALEGGGSGRRQALYADLPGYPGRLSRAGDGYWLAVFAPRSQLVEFVLREAAYRERMVAEVPQPYWIAPKLRAGRSFYEPLQGGGVKHLGVLKPWAPTLSAGLCVRLDATFQPVESLQSRADGQAHGIVGVIEIDGTVFAASQGDGVVVALPAGAPGGAA